MKLDIISKKGKQKPDALYGCIGVFVGIGCLFIITLGIGAIIFFIKYILKL